MENSGRYTYKITHISVDNCLRVLKLDIKVMLRHITLTLWADIKQMYLHVHEF